MKSSWKTTVAGCVAALGVFLTNQPGTAHIIGQVLTGVGTFLTGLWARDNNVTSEAAGAK